MAYQDWLTQASNTSAVSNTVPPALIPAGNSVLNEQPVPSSYTSNRAPRGNTAISSQGQINQIMNSINPQTGTTNPFSIPFSGGGGGGPSTWDSYSSGGDMTSYGGDTGGSSSIGQTSNIGTQGTMSSGAFSGYGNVGLGGMQTPGDWSNFASAVGNLGRRWYDNSLWSTIFGSTTPNVDPVNELEDQPGGGVSL